ncbi:methyltransferase domain-containing protein [Sulfitobacter sp. LCG007]
MSDGQSADQEEYWNSGAGQQWVRLAPMLDATMQPVLDVLLSAAALVPGERVLDVGCGTGASLRQAAEAVSPTGLATGADISRTMLEAAAERIRDLPQARTLLADVARHDFGEERADAMISRFGVMFFEDTPAAFANIARGLRPGGRMVFAAWGPVEENPWFTSPAQAAKTVLSAPPSVDPDDPGPFAFRHIPRVVAMLDAAGLVEIEGRAVALDLTPAGDLAEVAGVSTLVGPAQRAIAHFEADDVQVEAVRREIEARFAGFVGPQGVRIPAMINLFRARVAV